ncbi:hypothetical protein D9615_004821 [Tricholomella constricta]|uniref:DDE Tnp4 domain-containing protein n=1 Tax=Tricholomella constricta TaxID=117010 RepID=A0A8H5M6Z6_9AGAR|nr:hypothetical protein D9615_004821 [Tricholomella constricta]
MMSTNIFLSPTNLLLSEAEDDEEALLLPAVFLVVLAGIEGARQDRIDHRHRNRLYLRRNELLPNPRAGTPWQILWESQNDRAFITTMGFDVKTFRHILEGPGRFAQRWEETPVPRDDVSTTGRPRLGGRSLNACGALGLTLHYLGSAMLEVHLQQIFALVPSTVSRYLSFSLTILHQTLATMKEAKVSLPRTVEEFEKETRLICERHPLLEGAFGGLDGLSLTAEESDDPEMENATYNGWKSNHCINNVLAFSPQGTITMAVLNAPGSWHDSRVARPIFQALEHHVPDGYFLVADTAFPRGTVSIHGKIRAPMKGGEYIPADPIEQEQALLVNRQLLSYRQTAEWGMRMLQGSFGRLRVPLPISSEEKRKELLEICVRLSNVRARCVGINQIREVYMPTWRASEDDKLWTRLGEMVFGDIRRRDRVSRFHLVVADI